MSLKRGISSIIFNGLRFNMRIEVAHRLAGNKTGLLVLRSHDALTHLSLMGGLSGVSLGLSSVSTLEAKHNAGLQSVTLLSDQRVSCDPAAGWLSLRPAGLCWCPWPRASLNNQLNGQAPSENLALESPGVSPEFHSGRNPVSGQEDTGTWGCFLPFLGEETFS